MSQTGPTTGPSAFADDRGNDLAALKDTIKDVGSRSLRRTIAEINAGSKNPLRKSVSPGKALYDAQFLASTKVAANAQKHSNSLQRWELENTRHQSMISRAVSRNRSAEEIDILENLYDDFLREVIPDE